MQHCPFICNANKIIGLNRYIKIAYRFTLYDTFAKQGGDDVRFCEHLRDVERNDKDASNSKQSLGTEISLIILANT